MTEIKTDFEIRQAEEEDVPEILESVSYTHLTLPTILLV